MKIGLDFDEIIVEFVEHCLIFYHKKTGRKIEKKDVNSYDLWKVWGGTREEAIQMIDEFHDSKEFEDILPVEKAIESINSLMDKNEVFIITSRPQEFKEKTDAWIKKHFKNLPLKVVYTGDFHTGQGKTKAEICKEMGIKLIVEDNGSYAMDCAKSGIKVILFDKPWNLGIEGENIVRVENWVEALKEINKFTIENN